MLSIQRILVCAGVLTACSMAYAGDDPVFPYGAVYFRKTNPPEQDWAKDHKTAADVGMNAFRHWIPWAAVEVAPGKYDWRDYDRMMDLAAANGIKVILAEKLTIAPEWVFEKYPHARYHGSDDSVVNSRPMPSCAVGGYPGLCLDNDDVRALAERFLTAMVEHFRDHPALLGYDLWNEGNYFGGTPNRMYCFCNASQREFRKWLQKKYGTLDELGHSWYRYSYLDWDNVHPPRSFGGYPESLDWLEFRVDDAHRLFKWRTDLVKRLDPKHRVTAHGTALSLSQLPNAARNEWRMAEQVDTYGFTWWVGSDKGTEAWKGFHAVDLTRAGARGKPFWHAEIQGGPNDWFNPQNVGLTRENGRIPDEKDIRIYNMISMAGGATGVFSPRWRPLLDGPLFGAFGFFGMDGSSTPRSDMAGKLARFANSHPAIWKSRPIQGDIGIVFVPESQIFNYVQRGNTDFYAHSARGAYQAFFDSNIQPDFVHIDDIKAYPVVYLPYPVMLKQETVNKLSDYVEQGGILISEGTPAYFGDRGKVGTVQPNLGLDKLFGARESYVEFTPDLLDNLKLRVRGARIDGALFRQEYAAAGGTVVGKYENGKPAAIVNQVGKGKTLLIGTFPGAGYYQHHSPEARAFYAGLLGWAQRAQQVCTDDPDVKVRLQTGAGGTYLWAVNPTRTERTVTVTLSPKFPTFTAARDLWQERPQEAKGRTVVVRVGDRDAAVIQLN